MAKKGHMKSMKRHGHPPAMPPNTLSKGTTQGRYEARDKARRAKRLTGKSM